MIKEIFSAVVEMSINGAYIILAILIIRAAMKRLPKRFSYVLWAIPAVRLLCPFTIPSAVSLFNLIKPAANEKRIVEAAEAVSKTVPVIYDTAAEYIPPETAAMYYTMPSRQTAAVNAGFRPDIGEIAAAVWLTVAIGIVIYCIVCYVKMSITLKGSRRDGDYYISSKIESPLVFGFIRPKIYLTAGLSEADSRCILAHERTHIRRRDHIVKLICIPIAAIHWFNPLVWIGINRMYRDMELSCDEAALSGLGSESKKDYAGALLNMALRQNRINLCGVLCFGEKNIKSRIKGVLSMKKPKIIAIAAAVAVVSISAVCLLTSALPEEPLTLEEIMLTSPDAGSIPDVKYDKAVSFAGAEENVCLSYKVCGKYRFRLIAEKAFKDSEKSSDSIYVSKLKIIGKLPGGDYYEQELPGENLTLKSSKIESYLIARDMKKPLLIFNSPSENAVYLYTVTAEDGFVQMGEPITFKQSPDAYKSLCSYLSWNSYDCMMYDHDNNIRYTFDFKKFTCDIKYDYLDPEDAIARYVESLAMGNVSSAEITDITIYLDNYGGISYSGDGNESGGKVYRVSYRLGYRVGAEKIKDELFVINYSDSGARIEKIMPSIMCRTGTIEQRESDDGNPITVFIDEISGEEHILDIQASAVAFKCLSYQQNYYYPLDEVPNGTRAEICYGGDEVTADSIAYIKLLLY